MEFSSINRSARTFGSKIGESYGFPFIFEKERIFNDCVRAPNGYKSESMYVKNDEQLVWLTKAQFTLKYTAWYSDGYNISVSFTISISV